MNWIITVLGHEHDLDMVLCGKYSNGLRDVITSHLATDFAE